VIDEGGLVTVTADVTHPDVDDTHTGAIDWGAVLRVEVLMRASVTNFEFQRTQPLPLQNRFMVQRSSRLRWCA